MASSRGDTDTTGSSGSVAQVGTSTARSVTGEGGATT
jgi:hypothetical protein